MFELLIAAAATAATPTLEVTPRRMQKDGVSAIYTRSVDANGTVHLIGTFEDDSRSSHIGRSRFHYKIKGDKVEGSGDGVAYAFPRPKVR